MVLYHDVVVYNLEPTWLKLCFNKQIVLHIYNKFDNVTSVLQWIVGH